MPLYGLIGYPLSHSFSQKFFSEKFRKMGLKNFEYKNFEISGIDGLLNLLQEHKDLTGLNVTAPYKVAALEYLDEVDESVIQANAVNVILVQTTGEKKNLKGFNTDAIAFEKTFVPLVKSYGQKALILGTGGASRTVASVLRKLGIVYKLVSRNKDYNVLIYEKLNEEHLQNYKIIINTTPIGMYPDTNAAPQLPYQFLSSDHLVYDLIYNPEETLLLKKAKEQKARTKNGLEMLYLQAEKSLDIFLQPWKSKF